MIDRYSTPEMTSLWSNNTKFSNWLTIEKLIAQAMYNKGLITKDEISSINLKADFCEEEIIEIEKKTKHDFVAFLDNVASKIGEHGHKIHLGATSSDVIDTAFSMNLVKAGKLIIEELNKCIDSLTKLALNHKHTPCIGRSHGIHGEPITFGLKMLRFRQEFIRGRNRITNSIEEVNVCQVSGPMGNFSNLSMDIEEYVARELNMRPEDISSQIIPRDRYASFFSNIGILASSIENISTEIRNLHRTEIAELEEDFSKLQKGSSSMPHKKNPVLSENLTGLARIVRSYSIPAMENITLWHERDISHSSAERVIAPQATMLMHFMLKRLTLVIDNLKVNSNTMKDNIYNTQDLFASHSIMVHLVESGMEKEDAYRIVQGASMDVWNKKYKNLKEAMPVYLNNHHNYKENFVEEIIKTTNHENYIHNVDSIFERCLKIN